MFSQVGCLNMKSNLRVRLIFLHGKELDSLEKKKLKVEVIFQLHGM